MSVIGEVVGIVACVAAVISAYKDSLQIVQKIKDKRRRSEADPPSRYLEQSLKQGATAVEHTHRAGVDRFGIAFREGDDAALNALRDITIQLQQSMLRELSRALEDDSMQDFTAVENASDTARLRTVNVLNELFLRMQADASRDRSLPPPSADRTRIQVGTSDLLPPQRQPEPSRAAPPGRAHTLPDDNGPEALQRPYRAPPASVPKQKRNSNSLNYIPGISGLFPRRTKSSDKSGAKDVHPISQSMPRGLSRPRDGQVTSGLLTSLSLPQDHWTMGKDTSLRADPTDTDKPQRRHTVQEQTPQHLTSATVSTLTRAAQDFQGFCKGAYYLQAKLKSDGMKLRNQSGSFLGEKYYYACSNSKCCFEVPAHKVGKLWNFVDTVFDPSYGVKFRWSFLAKSHVEQSNLKKGSFRYRCIFCALQTSETPVLESVNSLIKHVLQHRDEELPSQGRVLVNGDDFDIHFVADDMPVDADSLRSGTSKSTIQEGSLWSMSDDGNPWEQP